MFYVSTRGTEEKLSFEAAVIRGLARDGGLYVPTSIPQISSDVLSKWKNASFVEIAFDIARLYIPEHEIPSGDLRTLIKKSYSTFRVPEVTPLQTLSKEKGLYVLELFHGPTYAFKDVALQFLGNLFEYFLQRRNKGKSEHAPDREIITVVGATSGDTGSAAIYGLRNKKDVSVFILYPTGRVSPIQEQQMTTVLDENVHTISVNGTFDDCQDLVKQIFADKEFNDKYHVGAVNSINWSRILSQITYYFYSYYRLCESDSAAQVGAQFVVPTGNFGDILAGFFAVRMGLPMQKSPSLVIATNSNDILYRFFTAGKYSKADTPGAAPVVHATVSPAMDILVSSNFERFLWYMACEILCSNDALEAGKVTRDWMSQLRTDGTFSVPEKLLEAARKEFSATRTTDDETLETIQKVYRDICPKYILDPHTAVAVHAALKLADQDRSTGPLIVLSTAHPAKFADAVDKALAGQPGYSFEDDVLPIEFKELATRQSKKLFLKIADIDHLKRAIIEQLTSDVHNTGI